MNCQEWLFFTEGKNRKGKERGYTGIPLPCSVAQHRSETGPFGFIWHIGIEGLSYGLAESKAQKISALTGERNFFVCCASVRTGLALLSAIPYDVPTSANAPRQIKPKAAPSRFGPVDGTSAGDQHRKMRWRRATGRKQTRTGSGTEECTGYRGSALMRAGRSPLAYPHGP